MSGYVYTYANLNARLYQESATAKKSDNVVSANLVIKLTWLYEGFLCQDT